MRGAKPYDGSVLGLLLALLALPLSVLWFVSLLAAFGRCFRTIFFALFSCRDYLIFTAVSGIIVLGMWVGGFALYRRKRIGHERSGS